jgi:hypothetical protein
MKIKLASLSILSVLPALIQAQSCGLAGRLTGENNDGIADVPVQLLSARDSSLVKTEFSNEEGFYRFEDIPCDSFMVFIQSQAYQKYLSNPVVVNGMVATHDIRLQQGEIALKEVAITAKKPFVEREHGKVILNVESSINAEGSSAFEFIEKAPGVRIDNNENISVNGKPGTVIWIDGKPSPLTGTDLSNFLRAIPSSSIDKIEIISNPSARYDAAGSSIVNIKLKKDKRVGTNGSLTLSYLQGVYPKTSNSFSVNHRDKKINVFGSYSYARRLMFTRLTLRRQFYKGDSLNGAFYQNNLFVYDLESHVARAGADFYINRNNTLGFVFNSANTAFVRDGNNTSQAYNNLYEQTSLFRTISRNSNTFNNYAVNLNYRHTFDTTGTELTTDIDFASYPRTSLQNIDTRYYDLSFNEYQHPYLLYGNLAGALRVGSVRNDFTTRFREWKLDAGQKSSYVVSDNDLAFYDQSNGGNIIDSTKSNHFIYTENINAAYLSANWEFKKWALQAGLRVEHTHVTGTQRVYSQNFQRNYAQLFPNLVITRKINNNNNLELNYSRRITRPGYDQLNPFKYYLDPTTYREGYPYLRPSTTESFELSHIYLSKIVTSLGFGRTYNNIIEVIAPLAGQQRVTVQTSRNLSMVDVFTLNGSIPAEVTKWWNTATNCNLYYTSYNGNVANTDIRRRGNLVFNFSSVNTFLINAALSAELSGNYQSREVYAFDVISPIWSVNLGVQQKLFGNRAILRLNISDIFYTNKIPATVKYTGYSETFLVTRDSRVATLSFTYKFGKNTVPAARRRQGGAEDIHQRAGNGVG